LAASPARLQAITTAKKKTDRIDARTLADLLRCRLLPEIQLLPRELRELRTVLRYRNLLVNQTTRLKNRIAGLLIVDPGRKQGRFQGSDPGLRKLFAPPIQGLAGGAQSAFLKDSGLKTSTKCLEGGLSRSDHTTWTWTPEVLY
jgi:transposase